MPYQIVDGHNNAGTLADVTIQPRCPGISVRVVTDGNGGRVIKGKGRTQWIYENLTAAQFATLLTEFGLSYTTAPSNQVTIRTTVNHSATALDRSYANYNATISIPPEPNFEWWWKAVVFEIVALEAL
jgi:hypothetical protein